MTARLGGADNLHTLYSIHAAPHVTRLPAPSVARDPANSICIASDVGAPSGANPAADRADIVGVAVAAAVANVIEGVASIERPAAHAKAASARDGNDTTGRQLLNRHGARVWEPMARAEKEARPGHG